MLLQIDRLVTRAFRNLKADEVLNFSVAVTVMRVQRKWRARMRAAKMKRKKEVWCAVGIGPSKPRVSALWWCSPGCRRLSTHQAYIYASVHMFVQHGTETEWTSTLHKHCLTLQSCIGECSSVRIVVLRLCMLMLWHHVTPP